MARRSTPASTHRASSATGPRWLGLYVVLGAAFVALIMFQPWSYQAASSDKPSRDEFASDRGGGADAVPVPFDGKRAMEYLEEVCKIGPRISGTDGMTK